jgi:cell filamentation protein
VPKPETKRRVFRRRKPYLIPGTTLLRNNFGADTHVALADLEFVSTAGRITGWHRRIADSDVGVDNLDFRAVHRALFADVYEWAGEFRVTELRLGDDEFARQSSVEPMMERVEATARAISSDDADVLADQLAGLYAEYNSMHPFREGNGRTGPTVLYTVASLRGRLLDLSSFSRGEWYPASHASMRSGAEGRADHRPFLPLFARALD